MLKLLTLPLFAILLAAAPCRTKAVESVFTNYLGQTMAEVIAAEGEPDEMTLEKGFIDDEPWPENLLEYDDSEEIAEDYRLIYKHKTIGDREFTVEYATGGETVYFLIFMDNHRETAPDLETLPDWNWLTDMGKSPAETVERWGLPQNYLHNVNWFNGDNFGISQRMLYDKLNINGCMYYITYHFHNNAAIFISGDTNWDMTEDEYVNYFEETKAAIIDLLKEPAWTCRKNRFSKIPTCILTDKKYVVTIDDILSYSTPSRITISVLVVNNADNAVAAVHLPNLIGNMMKDWEHDDVVKGGDYNKLVETDKKIEARLEQINAELEAQRRETGIE